MNTRRFLFFTIAYLSLTTYGFAALDQWRTQVQVSTRSGLDTQFASDGGLNVPSSFQTLGAGDSALSEAAASLNAGGFIPTLQTRATSSSTDAQAVAWGVQGYMNTSASPLSTTLLLDLTASITGFNDIDARIYLFQDENFQFNFDPGTMLYESPSQLWPGFEPFANNLGPTGFDIDITNFEGAVAEQRSFDFVVDPGDSFYVWARLVATADNPGVVDAFSTLTASFSDTTGLVPAAVPEPGTVALLLLSAFGCILSRRIRH